jgi:hypothetical protein
MLDYLARQKRDEITLVTVDGWTYAPFAEELGVDQGLPITGDAIGGFLKQVLYDR